jgi:squalene-hopene/tetraprenyl-beta-curcumene cyclase
MVFDRAAFEETLASARRALLAERNSKGYWEGELSSSALSTATAVFALSLAKSAKFDSLIERGLKWLTEHQNADGGWGDTVKSFSNISTTALCWAAFSTAPDYRSTDAVTLAEKWLIEHAGGIDPGHLITAIIARYGEDHTFSVPILTMCALAGRLGTGREAWARIPQLPFELAALPQRWFKWLRLPVVSYALPALIAIGLVRHRHRPSRKPVSLVTRKIAERRALSLLARIQPTSGGFLEATPLTSFVVMSLLGVGLKDHPVVKHGTEFLVRSVWADGSWPIDTNLATWVTTLSVNALANDPDFEKHLPDEERVKIRNWLLGQQYRKEHPYTLADPGCWAWTDLPGGVPDADDTPGAMIALRNLGAEDPKCEEAALAGAAWLGNLQNFGGGIPTFCRGWGKLPFDRSSADLTAHALRAWAAWEDRIGGAMWGAIDVAGMRGISYLRRYQREDGAWAPLWFGNQHAADEVNLTYGTSRVLLATPRIRSDTWRESVKSAVGWLCRAQNTDGGWGGAAGTPSSIEETALAVEALATITGTEKTVPDTVLLRGIQWLIDHTARGTRFEPTPIGFYFAKLWYFEKLYPLIFTVAALGGYKRLLTKPAAAEPDPAQETAS